jgi:hypothetical protein
MTHNIKSEIFKHPGIDDVQKRRSNPDDQHFLESKDLDGEYDHELCGARVWNHGFGGQCRRPSQKTNKELETRLVGWDGSKGGMCNCHFTIFKKKGKITHGLFTEMPPTDHPWIWKNSESAWMTLIKEKKADPTPVHYEGTCIAGQENNLDEFGNWIGRH